MAPARPTIMPPGREASTVGRFGDLVQFWSVRLPRILDPWAPEIADSFADDAWMAPWQKIAAIGPLAMLGLGFLAPWFWPGMSNIYSESLLFLLLASAGAILNWSMGAGLLLGYVAGDLLHGVLRAASTSGPFSLRAVGGQVVGYLLLWILVVRIPHLAQELTEAPRWMPSEAALRTPLRATLSAAASAGLVFLWCQGTIVLIRPVFTWVGGAPTDAAVMQVQVHWPWLVLFTLVAAAARVVLEDVYVPRSGGVALAQKLRQQRWAAEVRRGILLQSLPAPAHVILIAIFLTVILAGTYDGWIDALIVLVVTGAAGAWSAGVVGKVPQGWMKLMQKLPGALRIALATIGGFMIASVLLNLTWNMGEGLRAVMFGALLTVALFYALFPEAKSEGR